MAGLEPDQREPGNSQQAGEQKDWGTHGVGDPATAQNEAWGRLEKERRIKMGLCCDQMAYDKAIARMKELGYNNSLDIIAVL